MTREFKQVYDKKNLIKIYSKLFFIFMLTITIVVNFFTFILGSSLLFVVIIITLFIYLKSVRKIILDENQVIIKRIIGTIKLDFKYIGRIEKLNYKHIINLKRENLYSLFSIFGKDGTYITKQFETVKMISTSDKFKDNILIEYGIDYYILSVDNRDKFYEELRKIKSIEL